MEDPSFPLEVIAILDIILPLFVLLFTTLTLVSLLLYTWKNGIGPTPTSRRTIKKVLAYTKEVKPASIAELGAGWGTVAFAFAKAFPDTRITAYETSPVPYLYMKLRLLLQPQDNLVILRKNFLTESLDTYDFLYCYLYTGGMIQLQENLRTYEGWILSNTFAFRGWPESKKSDGLYLYSKKSCDG
ncbi:hypothetical protein [Thalassobacillus hwangdonensis]|uniref:Methyltransferase small domain-containing protein n=1 Tax=Thalassobacillus hwangdonensis TaxID=546108 RepID=A0ABW3L6X2_9BACI